MNISADRIQKSFLNLGIYILAISMTFSITFMNFALILLIVSFLILLFKKKITFVSTGLEIPILIFLGAQFISALFNPDILKGLKSVTDSYVYILHMYVVVLLFEEKQLNKFVKALAWSAVGISIYTILQSLIGLTFNLEFSFNETFKMVAPKLRKAFDINGYPVYIGTGVMGHQHTFGGQLLMLLFLVWGVFKKKWASAVVFAALALSFSCWAFAGLLAAGLAAVIFKKERKPFWGALLVLVSLLLIVSAPEGSYRVDNFRDSLRVFAERPVLGVSGSYSEFVRGNLADKGVSGVSPHSYYLNLLSKGGALTFLAFLLLVFVFIRNYAGLPVTVKERYRRLHFSCIMALTAVIAASIFRSFFTDAENAVLIWTLAGIAVKIKLSKWPNRLVSSFKYREE